MSWDFCNNLKNAKLIAQKCKFIRRLGHLNIAILKLFGCKIDDTFFAFFQFFKLFFRVDITGPADYQICFDNTFSYQTRKVVFFGELRHGIFYIIDLIIIIYQKKIIFNRIKISLISSLNLLFLFDKKNFLLLMT